MPEREMLDLFVLFVAVCVAGGQGGAMLRKRFTNPVVIEMAKLSLPDEAIIAAQNAIQE